MGLNKSSWNSAELHASALMSCYFITCTLCKNYGGETGRRLTDRLREHPLDVEKKNDDASNQLRAISSS